MNRLHVRVDLLAFRLGELLPSLPVMRAVGNLRGFL